MPTTVLERPITIESYPVAPKTQYPTAEEIYTLYTKHNLMPVAGIYRMYDENKEIIGACALGIIAIEGMMNGRLAPGDQNYDLWRLGVAEGFDGMVINQPIKDYEKKGYETGVEVRRLAIRDDKYTTAKDMMLARMK